MTNKNLSASFSAVLDAPDLATSGNSRQEQDGSGVGRAHKQRSARRVRLKVPYAPAFPLMPFRENRAEEWADFPPTHTAGTMPVSEQPGFDDGSIFCFWVGDQDPESVIDEVAEFIFNYDVAGVRFVRALPKMDRPSLEKVPC